MLEGDKNTRKDKVLELIVRSYIETAEPVGSRTLTRRYDLGLSPASIRNVMADLEEMGFIKQPHTSAGRIPTDRGYRYFVDQIMEPADLGPREKTRVEEALHEAKTIHALAERVSKVVAEITGNASILYLRNLKRVSFLTHLLEELIEEQKLLELLEEDSQLFIEGASRILEQPEFQDLEKMKLLLQAFDEKMDFLEIFLKDLEEEKPIHVHIGSENQVSNLVNISLVTKDCCLGGHAIGSVAVIGPTRMHYPKVISTVDYVAEVVSETLKRF